MTQAETITIDPTNDMVILKNGDAETQLAMDSAEAFSAGQ